MARLKLDPNAKARPATITLRLKYQACDAKACLAPATVELPVNIEPK